jgi:hypothetical protein
MPKRRILLVTLLLVAGCSRRGGTDDKAVREAGSSAPSASPTASSASAVGQAPTAGASASPQATDRAPPSARAPVSGAPGAGLEARRSSVARIEADPVLAANAAALRERHGGALPASLAVQATDLGADRRRGLLVAEERKDGALANPMVFVVDERGALVWSKDRPVAGITPPVGPSAIAAGPHGRFALAVCDPPTSLVALRLWDADGSPFADFQALATKACDALTLLYWPSHGWLIAVAAGSETRVQLVTDAGALAWGQGRVLGARFRTVAPASLASDSPSSFVLVQHSQSPGVDRDVDHAVAFRYDAKGEPLWAGPTDLGAVRRVAPGQERIVLTKSEGGVLRAHLDRTATVEIRSNGETRRVP